MSMVIATDGCSTLTGWKRRSSAASFSMCLRYSSMVVAPMVCSSPRANMGFRIDAASILKPMLARGELQTIGATTIDEYRKHIEKDAALERRFQPVKVEQPSVAMTIDILKGLREVYEEFHAVKITDQALIAAANLADRYISDRFLPDKAIDLIDEAGSRLRIRRMDTPPQQKKFDEDIMRVRADKESAMASGAIEQAKALEEQERELIAKRDELDLTIQASGGVV